MSYLVLIGVLPSGKEGAALSIAAFSTLFGRWGTVFVSVSICFFAFSTLLGWSYYGEQAVRYLFGGKDESSAGHSAYVNGP